MAILTTQTIEYESAASQQSFAALTDSGDHTVFTATSTPWSQASGYEPVIGPYGVIDGGAVIPAVSTTNDTIATADLAGNIPRRNDVITIGSDRYIVLKRDSDDGYFSRIIVRAGDD